MPKTPISLVSPPKERFVEEPLVTPRQTVERLTKRRGIKLGKANPPKCIFLSLSVGATQRLIDQTNAKQIDWIYRARPFYIGTFKETRVGIIWAAPGAPLAAMVMEDMIACGSRVFIGIGLFAGIQPNILPGDIAIPAASVRDEGTSYQYLPRAIPAAANSRLVESLAKKCKIKGVTPHLGQIWTTDAPYRETRSKVAYFVRRGIIGVDMESSAIFSLALYRKVKAACLLVASGNLSRKKGDIGFYDEKLNDSIDNTIRIALEVVSECSRK